jgi:hypothetical protein
MLFVFNLTSNRNITYANEDTVLAIVLVDATEQPIERPKKDNAGVTHRKRI